MRILFFVICTFVSIFAYAKTGNTITCDITTVVDHSIGYTQKEIIDVTDVPNCNDLNKNIAIQNTQYTIDFFYKGKCKPTYSNASEADGYVGSLRLNDSAGNLVANSSHWGEVTSHGTPSVLSLDVATYPNNVRHRITIYCASDRVWSF